MMKKILLGVIALIAIVNCNTQASAILLSVEENNTSKSEIKGLLLDAEKQTGLPFANIVVLHTGKGTISNEDGGYSISVSGINENDTISFQYLGYKTKKYTIRELRASPIVYLKENLLNLNDVFVYGTEPDPKEIIEKIIENKDSNYKRRNAKAKVFIRERYISNIVDINIKYKKSSFSQLNEDVTKMIEDKLPRNSTSYNDFLGYLYFSENQTDSTGLKVSPIKAVSLKDKEIDFNQVESIFEEILSDEKEKEYWKIKSGIFSSKIDLNETEEDSEKDSLTDSNSENTMKIAYCRENFEYELKYCNMNNKKDWEFLYKTNRYKYQFVGGTTVNNEDVYIIEFTPKEDGEFVGRVYVSTTTYALIRADYEYAEGKKGFSIKLFGISYSMNTFNASIYYEKKGDSYRLKYFSRKAGESIGLNRNLSLLKKKERFLIDKKLNEYKVDVNLIQTSDNHVEMLFLEDKEITSKQYADFKQKKKMKVIYVDQFDDKLWKGYSIIEPTTLIKEYKKQD